MRSEVRVLYRPATSPSRGALIRSSGRREATTGVRGPRVRTYLILPTVRSTFNMRRRVPASTMGHMHAARLRNGDLGACCSRRRSAGGWRVVLPARGPVLSALLDVSWPIAVLAEEVVQRCSCELWRRPERSTRPGIHAFVSVRSSARPIGRRVAGGDGRGRAREQRDAFRSPTIDDDPWSAQSDTQEGEAWRRALADLSEGERGQSSSRTSVVTRIARSHSFWSSRKNGQEPNPIRPAPAPSRTSSMRG